MELPILTDEQKMRETLLRDLMLALDFQERNDYNERPRTILVLIGKLDSPDAPLWMHFVDWYGHFDLDALLNTQLLEQDPTMAYLPNGTWQDRFPPKPYRLTAKAKSILVNRSRWVFDGKWE